MTSTTTDARFARAETVARVAMYLLLAVALVYVLFRFDHLDPSLIIAWGVVFAVLTIAKIALGAKARR